jgi:hypothetical protein
LETQINFKQLPSAELLEYISIKDEFLEEAKQAFAEFCFRFEKDIISKSEIYCNKFDYSEVIALEIAHCTFDRVWKYPTFNQKKSKSKDIDKGILLWMYPIIYTQIVKYGEQNSCAEPAVDEDFLLIEDSKELIEYFNIESIEKKRELTTKLSTIESALRMLSIKHRIIYFTYRAYQRDGKKVPRPITSALREKLSLTQKSINTYYGVADRHITNYLKLINERG